MRQGQLETLVRPLVVGIMIGCVALGVGELLVLIVPAWHAAFFAVVCVLVAIEAHYSYHVIQARSQFHTEVWKSRAIELGMLFVLVKIGSTIGTAWADVLVELSAWPNDLGRLFDAKTVAASALALIAWVVSTQAARELQQLDEPSGLNPGRPPVVESLTRWFFWGGAILLAVSGVARVEVSRLLHLDRPFVSGFALNVLLYFGLGLFMLGQVRFVSLRKRWREQKTEIGGGLAWSWVRYSLVLLVGAGLLAFLLPTGYTLGLLEAIAGVVAVVITILNVLYVLLMFPLILLMWLVSRLFSETPDASPPPSLGPLPLPSAAARRFIRLSLPASARALIFWCLAFGIVAYVVWSYLADRPHIWRALFSWTPVRVLRALWRALSRRVRQWQTSGRRTARQRAPVALVPVRHRSVPRFWFSVRSPRERVLYHYLGVLRRAGRRGLPRRKPETPGEYGQALQPWLPEVQAEVDRITESFVEAWYSRHTIGSSQGAEARECGRRIRSALRGQKLNRPPKGRSRR